MLTLTGRVIKTLIFHFWLEADLLIQTFKFASISISLSDEIMLPQVRITKTRLFKYIENSTSKIENFRTKKL